MRQIGIWRADFHRTLAPRIYEGGARRARGVPHPDAEKFLFEAVCPDFGLKQLPGWVGSSPPSVRTGVLPSQARGARTQARQSVKHQFIAWLSKADSRNTDFSPADTIS